MFTKRWIRITTMCTLFLLALPCLAQSSGYDRMDGDVIKPSKREQPKRNFNLTKPTRDSNAPVQRSGDAASGVTYTRTLSPISEDDRQESRAAKDRKTPERFRQPVDTHLSVPAAGDEAEKAQDGAKADKAIETREAEDVVMEDVAAPAAKPLPLDENQLVFCSKRLHEFHWDVDCPMLKNVKPTRLTYKVAREARFTECTACGAARLESAPTR